VLIVGAGEMGAGFTKALAQADGPARVVVAKPLRQAGCRHRGPVGRRGCQPLEAGRRARSGRHRPHLDGFPEIVLDTDRIDKAMRSRPGRPLLVVDVAVPRDVDAAAGGIGGVSLFDVEDVRRFAEAHMAARRGEIPVVRAILAEELDRYRVTSVARSAAPVVAALRARAESIRRGELERQQARLEALGPEAVKIVEAVTKRTVAKLLHEPTVRVKEAAGSPGGERLAEALRNLFDL